MKKKCTAPLSIAVLAMSLLTLTSCGNNNDTSVSAMNEIPMPTETSTIEETISIETETTSIETETPSIEETTSIETDTEIHSETETEGERKQTLTMKHQILSLQYHHYPKQCTPKKNVT